MLAIRKQSLILIEPDEAVRAALQTLLEGRGWSVTSLCCGEELEEAYRSGQHVAVVSESALPDLSAESVLESGRKHGVPIIFTGHDGRVQQAVDLVRMGARDFLQKPFPQSRLIDLLDGLS